MAREDGQEWADTPEGAPLLESNGTPTPRKPFLYDVTVAILVGPEESRLDVHRELVCSKSDFFAAALKGHFSEAGTRMIRLPEQDVRTFRYFMHWLYTGKLSGYFAPEVKPLVQELNPALKRSDSAFKEAGRREDNDMWMRKLRRLHQAMVKDAPIPDLVSLYVLADALQVRGLRDLIVTFIIRVYGTDEENCGGFWKAWTPVPAIPNCTVIMAKAYNQVASIQSLEPLRDFIVDLYVDRVEEPVVSGWGPELNATFMYECFVRLHLRLREEEVASEADGFGLASHVCRYHIHEDECTLTQDMLDGTVMEDW